jgi:hypothetical protein
MIVWKVAKPTKLHNCGINAENIALSALVVYRTELKPGLN